MREIIRQKDQIIQVSILFQINNVLIRPKKKQERTCNSEQRDQLREMESTLQWRDNKIKALEAQRDYFMKKASEQVSLSKSQVFVKRVFCVLFLPLKMGFYSHFDKTFYFSLSSSDFLRRIIL